MHDIPEQFFEYIRLIFNTDIAEEYIELIKDYYAAEFKDAYNKTLDRIQEGRERKCDSIVDLAFDWEESEEGYDWWFDLANELAEYNVPPPGLPEIDLVDKDLRYRL